jgi:hypothetical protein
MGRRVFAVKDVGAAEQSEALPHGEALNRRASRGTRVSE